MKTRKWFTVCIALLLGVVGAAKAEESVFYVVQKGDTMLGRFGPVAAPKIAKLNKLADWNKIYVGQKLRLSENVRARDDMMVFESVVVKTRAAKVIRSIEASCINIGISPFNPEHELKRMLEGIDLLTELTPEKRELAKRKFLLGEKATENELVGQQIFTEMLYQSKDAKKGVVHVYDKPICSPEQGGQPEVMDTYDLGDGEFLSNPRRCGNPSVFVKPVIRPSIPTVIPGPTPTALAPPPATPALAPPPPPPQPAPPPIVVPPQEQEIEQIAREYDWDLGFFIGGDKDVRFAGGEGAIYPFIRYADWGRYALGGGGSFSLWNGGTPDGYRYRGEMAAFGLAQKFSFNNRRDLGIKFPMIGGLWERGHDASGKYQQQGHVSLWCASANYTDASREKDGKKWVPEWQLWASLCGPLSQAKSHSYDGKALDATIPDTKYIMGIGGRVFLSKNLGNQGLAKKLQPFVEVGLNKTAPNPTSGHIYGGLRTVNKVWGLGAGLHFADSGNTLGATLTYDAGRHYKLRVIEERWTAMLKGLKEAGATFEEDGTVVMPIPMPSATVKPPD